MFFGSRNQQDRSGLGIVGIIALLFGIIWIVAIFDSFLKVPSDLDRTVELSGDYIVTDQTFLVELRGSATITALLASGGGPLLASPAALEVLQSPALGSLLANPAAIALLTNAGVQALLADPAALTLVLDARTLQLLANPADAPTLTFPVLIHRKRKPHAQTATSSPSTSRSPPPSQAPPRSSLAVKRPTSMSSSTASPRPTSPVPTAIARVSGACHSIPTRTPSTTPMSPSPRWHCPPATMALKTSRAWKRSGTLSNKTTCPSPQPIPSPVYLWSPTSTSSSGSSPTAV